MPIAFLMKRLPKVSEKDTARYARFVKRILAVKAKSIFRRIENYISGKKILDIGVGVGGILHELLRQGFDAKGIDVADLSLLQEARPIIYDGDKIPFHDNSFDTALLIHVLHHCKDGLEILKEAKRVAKRVIVIDDTYRNMLEHIVVSLNDMIGNFEFYPHPYHPTAWWKNYIERQGWKLIRIHEFSDWTYGIQYGRYVLFVIES